MKNIRSVFIILIGIISITAFATTSKLDQKQKTVLTTENSVSIEAVNVDYDFKVDFVLTEAAFSQCTFIESNQKTVNPSLEITADLGLKSEKRNYSLHFKQSNSLKKKVIKFVSLIDKGNNIRNDC